MPNAECRIKSGRILLMILAAVGGVLLMVLAGNGAGPGTVQMYAMGEHMAVEDSGTFTLRNTVACTIAVLNVDGGYEVSGEVPDSLAALNRVGPNVFRLGLKLAGHVTTGTTPCDSAWVDSARVNFYDSKGRGPYRNADGSSCFIDDSTNAVASDLYPNWRFPTQHDTSVWVLYPLRILRGSGVIYIVAWGPAAYTDTVDGKWSLWRGRG